MKTRIAIIGCGFWANYQIPAWKELPDAEIVGVCDRNPEQAGQMAARFEIPGVYTDAASMLDALRPDLADIITTPESHAPLVELAAERRIPVISQKPLTPTWEETQRVAALCRETNTPLFVHENFRWQAPFRKIKALLDSDAIGAPFRARLSFNHNFPVFDNQPNLRELDEMIVADLGVHLLDTIRFLLGEAESLYCQTAAVTPGIRGEDVATILLRMKNTCQVVLEMSFASHEEKPSFPQTLAYLEGPKGSIALRENYEIALTKGVHTEILYAKPQTYPWLNPDYAVVHSSIVDCNRNLLQAVRGEVAAETTGADNLETMRLVYLAYESARTKTVRSTNNPIPT
jgi:D-apiose dehydrogenase